MVDKTYTYIFYDILDKVLQYSENPSQFAEFLSQQIREIIGAKTIVIAINNNSENVKIFSVYPSRRKEWCNQQIMLQFAKLSFEYEKITFFSNENKDNKIAGLLTSLNIEKTIIIPLYVAGRSVGSILLLDIMDMFGIDSVIDLLTRLSGVFALIIRNSLLYHNLEDLIEVRTKELQKRNEELLEREQQLKAANEEYEILNKELYENIKKVEETNIQLEKAKEKAEESDRLKTAFLQNMSHEIRTPMNAIIGFSGFLSDHDVAPEKMKSYTNIIQNSTHQLLSIVTDILTISSIETKQEKVAISEVCINNILINLISIFSDQAAKHNIALHAKYNLSDKQSEIFTDKTKVTQILTNLLTNALKFTHEGFVEFGYKLKNNELEFYVKDTGIGIDIEKQKKIFKRFVQADTTIQQNYGGTGLGLSICEGFIELLHGNIWVDSKPGEGSIFYFSLPYNPVHEIPNKIGKPDNNTTSITILIAEDDEFNKLLLKELLIKPGYNLLFANDGKEAIELCMTHPYIDLILMDIKMPNIDGHTAAKIIKETHPTLPIIAQSAYALENERATFEIMFDDYITKPIDEVELMNKINKYTNHIH